MRRCTRTRYVEPPLLSPHNTNRESSTANGRCGLNMPGLVPVGDILDSISITRLRAKQLDAIQLVREQRESRRQELAYHARPFVLCGLPLRRPPVGEMVHRRQNGKFFLEVVAHPRYGLPTVRADCTCSQFAFGMGRNSSSLPPAAGWAI